MMLTTKGRKTGRERTTPVLYLQHGADLIVVASFGGNDMHPAWYLNLERCPKAEVIINGECRRLLAYRVSPDNSGSGGSPISRHPLAGRCQEAQTFL